MKLKTSLRNTLLAAIVIGVSTPSYAIWSGAICAWIGLCSWPGVLTAAARVWTIAQANKVTTTEIDATAGFQEILNNIGKGEGPGISATGNTGADLTSEEEGAEMQAEQARRAATVPNVAITYIVDAEKDEGGKDFYKLREINAQFVLADYCYVCSQKSTTGSDICWKYEQKACSDTEKHTINADCSACSEHENDQCVSFDSVQCAEERQNKWLYVMTSSAAAEANASKKSITEFREKLIELLKHTGSSGTVAGWWSNVQTLSVQANAIVPEITRVYAADLQATSVRRVAEQGVEIRKLPDTTTEGDQQ